MYIKIENDRYSTLMENIVERLPLNKYQMCLDRLACKQFPSLWLHWDGCRGWGRERERELNLFFMLNFMKCWSVMNLILMGKNEWVTNRLLCSLYISLILFHVSNFNLLCWGRLIIEKNWVIDSEQTDLTWKSTRWVQT